MSTARTRPAAAILSDANAYLEVAKAIAGDALPAPWIAAFLENWAPSLLIDIHVNQRQPTRREMLDALKEIQRAAATIKAAVVNPIILEFLDLATAPAHDRVAYEEMVDDLARRALEAQKLQTLSTSDGHPRNGAGRASLPNSSTPREFCAALIIEAWHGVHSVYPRPANQRLAQAAQLMWEAVEAPRRGWADRRGAWRPYFKAIEDERLAALRAEIKRHVKLLSGNHPLHSFSGN